MNSDVVNWMTWLAAIVPLWALAWSAYHYVNLRQADDSERQYNRLFTALNQLGSNSSIVAKCAAAYELRKFPEYADLIVRVCEQVPVEGTSTAVKMLQTELALTVDHMKKAASKE